MKRPVFLSASVPNKDGFDKNLDPMAIREAVIALAAVTLRDRPLVFGGHPAISPLVEHAARSLGALQNVHIYQSRFFEDRIPEVARAFENLHWTNKDPTASPTEADSLAVMRREMIGAWDFCGAVFVGGMEGIFAESELFREIHGDKPQIVLGSTGGAAEMLLRQMRDRLEPEVYRVFEGERRYRRIMRRYLPED